MSGKWEVAGKSKKATVNKKAPKKLKRELPTVDDEASGDNFPASNPLTEHQNIYNLMATSEDEAKPVPATNENKENYIAKPRAAAKSKPKKKPSPTVKKNDRELLVDQLEQFDISELKQLISDVQKKFPKHALVWLKDVQSYFQMKVKVRESDAGLLMFECGYPYNLLGAETQDFLGALYREVPDSVMSTFYMECLNTFARDVRTGAGTYHHRMLLQSMSLHCPKTHHSKTVTTELKTLLDDSTTRTKECVALLWCLQMTPRTKLDTKLKVWFTWMLPILQGRKTEKPVQDFILRCIEDIVNEIGNSKETFELTPSDFFGYFDLVFTINSNLYPHVQVLLLEMLDSVKCVSFGNPDKRLRAFFPSLLIRLHASETSQKSHVLRYLVECLKEDQQCWVLWQQMFSKHPNNSLVLLEHIHQNWKQVTKTLNKTALKQTIDYLTTTLTPTAGKTKLKDTSRRSLELCNEMKQALGSPIKAGFKLLVVVLMTLSTAYILHDIKEFGSFSSSRTGRMYSTVMEHNAVKQSVATAQKYGSAAHEYGMKNSPVLMDYLYTICNSVSSTLTLFAICVQNNFNYVVDNRQLITQQVTNVTVELAGKAYTTASSLTSPETKKWLEDTGLEYMEVSGQYLSLGKGYVVQGTGIATEQYALFKDYFVQNFINDPVTVDRLKAWAVIAQDWLLETYTFAYNKLYTTFVA